MKKILTLLTVIVFACSVNSFAQAPESDVKYVYCEIVGIGKMLSNKVNVQIDFGQASGMFEDTRLKDENGKAVKFNSMVDAMNWMGNDGWEFAQAYVISTGQQNVYHWLLKKDVSKLSEEEKQELLSKFKTSID